MNKKLLIYLLLLIFIACKKQDPTPPQPAKPLASTRSTNVNGHNILTSYNYNSNGLLYQQTTKDESTGVQLFQQYIYENGVLHRSEIYNDNRKLSSVDYTVINGKVTKMS